MFKFNLGVSAHTIATTVTLAAFAFAPDALAHNDHADTNAELVAKQNAMALYFERLPGKKGAPIGFDKTWARNQIINSGGTENDVAFMLENVDKDICLDVEIKRLCAYFGAETIYKVSQMAYSIRYNGGSDDDVTNAVTPIFDYGITKHLEGLYGKKGLSDEDFTKIAGRKGISAKIQQERGQPQKLKNDNSRFLCLGLNTNVDTQTISTTNPIYGRQYRMVNVMITNGLLRQRLKLDFFGTNLLV